MNIHLKDGSLRGKLSEPLGVCNCPYCKGIKREIGTAKNTKEGQENE